MLLECCDRASAVKAVDQHRISKNYLDYLQDRTSES